jgi:hypothetical protein
MVRAQSWLFDDRLALQKTRSRRRLVRQSVRRKFRTQHPASTKSKLFIAVRIPDTANPNRCAGFASHPGKVPGTIPHPYHRAASAKGNWYLQRQPTPRDHPPTPLRFRTASRKGARHPPQAPSAPAARPSLPHTSTQPNPQATSHRKVTSTYENQGPTIKNPTHTAGPIVSRKTLRYYPPHLRRSSALSPPEVSP